MDIDGILFRTKKPVDIPAQKPVSGQAVNYPDDASLEQKVIAAIRTIYDPEIHVNVYDLGLIYHISINDDAEVEIDMTLTAPACPVAEILPAQVVAIVKTIPGINDAKIKLVWDPPWHQGCLSEAARLDLGLL